MAETLTLSHLFGARPDRVAERSPKPGLFVRVVAAMIEQRQRQADHHIERHGGKITDTVERGIESRILSPGRGF